LLESGARQAVVAFSAPALALIISALLLLTLIKKRFRLL